MTLTTAIRLTEILLALALIQQSLEHVLRREKVFRREQLLFGLRIALCALLIAQIASPWPLAALAVLSLLILDNFQGPYNGGSDRISLLILWSLTAANLIPHPHWQEVVFGYLGLQLVLSYFVSGWVKVVNPDWRRGLALQDVFLFSAYPCSEDKRSWANKPAALLVLSWLVMLFELAFPLVLVSKTALWIGLSVALVFHLANAVLFGLNRFVWAWLAAYPSLIWLQARLI
ncbi:MAG: HTTM domain-containing protein [Burkholderiaceae bacterium]